MTNTTTLPEDRPMTFTLPAGRDWLEPGDADYGWVLDDLREHEAIGAFLNLIMASTAYGEQPADITLPTIAYGRRGRIELTWCSVEAVFAPTWRRSYRLESWDADPFSVRPDGKIMVTA